MIRGNTNLCFIRFINDCFDMKKEKETCLFLSSKK